MKLVGRIARVDVDTHGRVKLEYPPFDVLVARVGSDYVAIEDACNHAGASLYAGSIFGETVGCPLHGYIFELRTGKLRSPRGLCADQRTFVVRIEGDDLVVFDPFALTVS